MEQVDLEKDLDKLEYYTAGMLAENLDLLADHYENIYKGKMIAYCISCISKHLRKIGAYSAECQEGKCRLPHLWSDLAIWAVEADKYTDKLAEKDKRTLELSQEARDHRKKMEEVVERTSGFLKEKQQEHLT